MKTTIPIPDIGGEPALVVEILVKPGDHVSAESSLITLEGDKSTMDVPAPHAGIVEDILVKVGDRVEAGQPMFVFAEVVEGASLPIQKKQAQEAKPINSVSAAAIPTPTHFDKTVEKSDFAFGTDVHAGPIVRRIATEFGVNLLKIKGSGEKGRITKEDVQQFVRTQLHKAETSGSGSLGFDLPKWPHVDFSQFGPTTLQPLSKIKRVSGAALHRNWVSIPHVTQFEEADITELEAFRQEQKELARVQGVKLTPIVFIMKAVVATLKAFPIFNASLDQSATQLILKQYYHIGVAVDTPQGLVVPVVRDVDRKGIYELAQELGDLSQQAREKGLSTMQMQGGCFTISSLGGIGGTAFTPIINAPEVAILGVSRSEQKPVYLDFEKQFVPRLMLPLSLSYDHRVIDGADGARFMVALANRLADIRKILL